MAIGALAVAVRAAFQITGATRPARIIRPTLVRAAGDWRLIYTVPGTTTVVDGIEHVCSRVA